MLGRVISFGDAAYITDTIALQCTDALGTIVLGRVINLGGTTDITGTIIHVTLSCKNSSDTIVLGQVIRFGDTAYIINTITLQCTNVRFVGGRRGSMSATRVSDKKKTMSPTTRGTKRLSRTLFVRRSVAHVEERNFFHKDTGFLLFCVFFSRIPFPRRRFCVEAKKKVSANAACRGFRRSRTLQCCGFRGDAS
jgi:hypothetical protein